MNQEWLTILKQRGTYSFPHLWRWTSWGNFALFGSLLVIAWMILRKKLFGRFNYEMGLFIIICLGIFIFNVFISWPLPVISLIQFQLVRTVNFIFIIALIVFAGAVQQNPAALTAIIGIYFWGDHLTGWHFSAIWLLPVVLIFLPKHLKNKKFTFLNLLLISILAADLFFRLVIIKPKIFWPYYFSYPNVSIDVTDFPDWLAAQEWARQNTPVDTVFLTPPTLSGWRSFSQRSIVGDLKDGAVVFYTWDFTKSWQEKMGELKNFNEFKEADFIRIKDQYPFQYLVVGRNFSPLEFTPVYSNACFIIYKI